MTDDTYRATPEVWRKRILQVPTLGFNLRNWTFGFSWSPSEDSGDFVISFGPVGLIWDAWP